MGYVLERKEEFDRLERQSEQQAYDFKDELRDLQAKEGSLILDAGCGSGVVSRYLATHFPKSRVIACDCSALRIAQAAELASSIGNLRFETQDLKQLDYPDDQFDVILSRYVVEHQTPDDLQRVVSEMVRVLKPGGRIVVVDVDGIMHNIYPQTRRVAQGLGLLLTAKRVDLHVGRKIPWLLAEAGLTSISWRVEVMSFQGASKSAELELMRDRFAIAAAFFEEVLGRESFQAFKDDYLQSLAHPQAVSFFNKFIVSATKPELRRALPIDGDREPIREGRSLRG